ncbi:MAG: diaminopimelate epimerase [Ignavibacteriae bacterium]|nr:MAG: diaminopimelate epimerase [Ignavibacteriota bacterium]
MNQIIRNSKLSYSIYSGAGNDFVMIDNRENVVPFDEQAAFTENICNKLFPGIDGVIFLDKPISSTSSIRMNYYNRDGSYGAMCGNGARCIAQFAADKGILTEKKFNLEAVDKIYTAEIVNNNKIKIGFPPPSGFKLNINTSIDIGNGPEEITAHTMSVGSDHIIVFIEDEKNKKVFGIDDLDNAKINEWGKILRFHADFAPNGGNVSFVQLIGENKIRIRTYERGVERETLACGTGVISSSVISALRGKVKPPVKILVQSGDWLTVDFNLIDSQIENLSLEGPAKKISEGVIEV